MDDVSFSLKEGGDTGNCGGIRQREIRDQLLHLKLVEEPGVVEAEQILFDGRDLSRAR